MKRTNTPATPQQKRTLRYMILLVLNTVLLFGLYRALLYYAELTDETFWSFVVFITYAVLLLGFSAAYFIYNRFFYRKNLTPEQLPDDWSPVQKEAFLEDGRRRMEKSRWMLLIILPLLLTFLFDTIDLFIIDPFFRK